MNLLHNPASKTREKKRERNLCNKEEWEMNLLLLRAITIYIFILFLLVSHNYSITGVEDQDPRNYTSLL